MVSKSQQIIGPYVKIRFFIVKKCWTASISTQNRLHIETISREIGCVYGVETIFHIYNISNHVW